MKLISEEDYTVMRDIYTNQPIKITSDGKVNFKIISLKILKLSLFSPEGIGMENFPYIP